MVTRSNSNRGDPLPSDVFNRAGSLRRDIARWLAHPQALLWGFGALLLATLWRNTITSINVARTRSAQAATMSSRELSEHMQVDQRTSLKQLQTLREHIDHIKQIVTMQQSLATASAD